MTKIFTSGPVGTKNEQTLALPHPIAHIHGAKSVACGVFIFERQTCGVLHGSRYDHAEDLLRVDNPGAATERM
jgi:hypothetical protein